MLFLAVFPRAGGEMRLIALSSQAPVVATAIAAGATIVAAPRGGGVIVRGSRSALLWPALRAGILPLAATGAGCGESAP